MGGQGSGAIIAEALRSKSTPTAAASTPKTHNSSVLVRKDNINDKPPQSPEVVKNPQKYVLPLISVVFSCSIILLTRQTLVLKISCILFVNSGCGSDPVFIFLIIFFPENWSSAVAISF